MRPFQTLSTLRATPAGPRRRPASRAERGQALVIIAMAMVGLLAFIGLTVDAGILYIGVGHLRRAVDAAALAASAQFREGRNADDQEAAAREVIDLNGVQPDTLELWLCVTDKNQPLDDATHHDPALCPAAPPKRKLIRIRATTTVRFAFLTIIGLHSTEISAQAVSEAASVDVVLVIDTSNSMTQDYGDRPLPPAAGTMWNPDTCNADNSGDSTPGECHPFEEVKQAAANFVAGLNLEYDRVSIVTFALTPTVVLPITHTLSQADVISTVLNLQVSPVRDPPGYEFAVPGCESLVPGQNVSGCQNTSIGGGLKLAGNQFGIQPIRQESVWVVILLTDGGANASESDGLATPPTLNKFCPSLVWDTNCRDEFPETRHTVLTPTIWAAGNPGIGIPALPGHSAPFNPDSTFGAAPGGDPFSDYDTDDFARDMADFVACAPTYAGAAVWCRDSLNYIAKEGGQGAVIYAIGLGKSVATIRGADILLRYIQNVGQDGDPNPYSNPASPDPCELVPAFTTLTPGNDSYNCGNYYFAEFGTGLSAVFESIASRIFTRLTQ